MEKRYGLVTDYSGNVVPGSTITVTNYPAGTIASLFRDNAGTPEDNPFVANDADGRYTFYAADGRYRIDIAPPLDANLSASSVIDVILSDTAYLQKASKAEVAALPLTQYDAGKKVFITSDDGGPGTIRYDAGGGHSDDGGSSCGTKFIPTGGDGTIYWERDYQGPLKPQWYGAKGDGTTVDTTAIDQMFAAYETRTKYEYTSASQRNIVTLGNAAGIYWPPGHYLYGGTGWQPDSQAGRSIVMYADSPNSAIIELTSDTFLIDYQSGGSVAPNLIHCENLKVCGGKGLYMNRQTTAVPQAEQTFINCYILDFSECAIGSYWGDSPRWTVKDSHIETVKTGTKGLFLPAGLANPDFSNTTIVGCTYKIVLTPANQSLQFIRGLTMFSLSTDDHKADIWLMAIDAGVEGFNNAGNHTVITQNRMSSENRNGKPCILIADYTGTGDLHTLDHSTSATTKIFRDLIVTNNVVSGEGSADAPAATTGNFIDSYSGEIGAMWVYENYLNNGFNEILHLYTTPSAGYASDLTIGPNHFQGGGDRPIPCNLQIGNWRFYDNAEMPSLGTSLSFANYDYNYILLSQINNNPVDMSEVTLSNATSVIAADAYGGNFAREITFTTGAGYANIPLNSIGSIAAGSNIFLEIDIKEGATQALEEVDVEIAMTSATGSETIRRSLQPTSQWMPVRIPFSANEALTAMTIRFYASADAFSSGVTDKVQLYRPRVYGANRPVNHEHLVMLNHRWNQSHIISRDYEGLENHIWLDWTNSFLRTKYGTPSTEVDGAIISTETTATTAQLTDITDAINTSQKYQGKRVTNTTTGIQVFAAGSTAGALWLEADGTTEHTPV